MNKIILFALAAIFISSCATKLPFSTQVREKYKLNEMELSKLQFYLSDDIVITKGSAVKGGKTMEDGELVISSESMKDKIIFKQGTEGLFESIPGTNKIAIRFEVGEGKYLVFGAKNPKSPYSLQAQDWKSNGVGVLQYGGETYHASISSGNAYLMFKLKRSQKHTEKQHVVGGMKVK